MNILHIIAGMPPESGIAAVVTRLAGEQRRLGNEVAVATTEVGGQRTEIRGQLEERVSTTENTKSTENIEHSTLNIEHRTGEKQVRVVTFRRGWPHFLYFSWGMLMGLGKEVREADVVHVHSNWTFPVWWGAWLALREKKTLVMSPHGALDPVRLKHSAWKKRLVGWMDRWLLRRASVIHATCEGENAWVQAFLEVKSEKLKVKSDAEKRNLKLETGNLKLGGALRVERPRIVVIPNGVGE